MIRSLTFCPLCRNRGALSCQKTAYQLQIPNRNLSPEYFLEGLKKNSVSLVRTNLLKSQGFSCGVGVLVGKRRNLQLVQLFFHNPNRIPPKPLLRLIPLRSHLGAFCLWKTFPLQTHGLLCCTRISVFGKTHRAKSTDKLKSSDLYINKVFAVASTIKASISCVLLARDSSVEKLCVLSSQHEYESEKFRDWKKQNRVPMFFSSFSMTIATASSLEVSLSSVLLVGDDSNEESKILSHALEPYF